MSGTGIAGSEVICWHLCPRLHTIQNSAEISSSPAAITDQRRALRTFLACSFVFMPPP